MPKIHQYDVKPALPPRLSCLADLSYNLRWTWDNDAVQLFERLGAGLWRDTGHNPVLMLQRIAQDRLEAAAQDDALLAHLDRVCSTFKAYMEEPGWFPRRHPEAADINIAYFCMEFGLTESLPIYSGGLGVLAGDHLKTASELDLPLTGIGLLYQKGYFKQYLNADGWQLEQYPVNDFSTMPITPVLDANGDHLRVHVDLAGREVPIRVWQAQVGRIPLYLLDTNLPENSPVDRDVTDELYGGGPEERIRQEIVLGIGGIRVLEALGIRPEVCHMNEGHSAFLSLERVRRLMEEAGLDYRTGRQVAGAGTLFTTHTPVPAGFDLFSSELMDKYFSNYIKQLGLGFQEFIAKGRVRPQDQAEPFNVAALSVRHAPRRNAVSELHRDVTARMMMEAWADFPESEVPVSYVTNGALVPGWVSAEMAALFDRYLGPRWREDPSDQLVWALVHRIPHEELWRTHVRQREALVAYTRSRLEEQLIRRNASRMERERARQGLDADALTIGFARRFATYKRASLILREPERLEALLRSEERPVQLIFAGKAHPRDDAGKDFIRQIVRFAKERDLGHRLVFLEDYDIEKARVLVQGADVWLNNPRRPLEASGTSGMKAVFNGALNLSVLDGWWAEGYRPGAGWAIGRGEEYTDFEYQDRVEAQALYSILEQEVVPLFYDRGPDNLPRGWIAMMKNSIEWLSPQFSSTRMVKEYAERFYLPAAEHYARLSRGDFQKAKELVSWKACVTDAWQQVRVDSVRELRANSLTVGQELGVEARVALGSLQPSDVRVEAYFGRLGPDEQILGGTPIELEWVRSEGSLHAYRAALPTPNSGRHGFAVRLIPQREDVLIPNEMPLIKWEG